MVVAAGYCMLRFMRLWGCEPCVDEQTYEDLETS